MPSRKGGGAGNKANRIRPLAFLADYMQCQEGAICICGILLWADRVRKQGTYEVNSTRQKYSIKEENKYQRTTFFIFLVEVSDACLNYLRILFFNREIMNITIALTVFCIFKAFVSITSFVILQNVFRLNGVSNIRKKKIEEINSLYKPTK